MVILIAVVMIRRLATGGHTDPPLHPWVVIRWACLTHVCLVTRCGRGQGGRNGRRMIVGMIQVLFDVWVKRWEGLGGGVTL